MWKKLYAKLRADITTSIGTGGLTVGATYVLDALGVQTSPEEKTLIALATGWVGGKIGAYLKTETGPKV